MHKVGPFDAQFDLGFSVYGGTEIHVPPLGALEIDSHDGPFELDVDLSRLRQAEAEELLRDPERLETIGDRAADDIRDGVRSLAIKTVLWAVGGATVLTLIVRRGRRAHELLFAFGLVIALFAASGGVVATTLRPEAIAEPKYTGLLTNAPALVGDARQIVDRFDAYREELAGLITNVSELYAATSTLPVFEPDPSTVRVLHVSDLHLNPSAFDVIRRVVGQFKVNVIADTGDIVDLGSGAETQYVESIGELNVPYMFIRGNHDSEEIASAIAAQPNAHVLDGGPPITINGLTFLGKADPRFTPDKETRDDDASVSEVQAAGRDLERVIQTLPEPPDVTMVHDPVSAVPLQNRVPVVLAGHTHERRAERLGDTLLLVQGSTGGAGLRGLQGEEPTPIECSVLYFDAATQRLQAYDDITLGGLGQTEATIQRHVVTTDSEEGE